MNRSAWTVRIVALLGPALLSCSNPPEVVPTRNLDRPSDLGFVCLQVARNADGKQVVTGRPMNACHPQRKPTQAPIGVDVRLPRVEGTFSLVTNTARGELAAVDLDTGKLIDLDPQVFGFNMVPLGVLPESISVSQDGCRAVTANRGSCDFSAVDPSRVLAAKFSAPIPEAGQGARPVFRFSAQTASGDFLHAAPYEVVFLHGRLPALPASPGDAPSCQAGKKGPRFVATFPNCGLVAVMEIPDDPKPGESAAARILDSVKIGAGGELIRQGANPSCPVECGAGRGADAGPAGGPDIRTAGGVKLGPMALSPEGGVLFLGALDAPLLATLGVTADGEGAILNLLSPGVLTLSEDALGTTRLRLSVDPFAVNLADPMAPVQGGFVGDRGRFLYALAKDGSVRVVSLGAVKDNRAAEDSLRFDSECDLNIDESWVEATDRSLFTQGCFPVADGTDKSKPVLARPRRRPFAVGPGLRIPTIPAYIPSPIVRDVSFAEIGREAIAFVLTSGGEVYRLNLGAAQYPDDGVRTEPEPTLRLTHGFRQRPDSESTNAAPVDPATSAPRRSSANPTDLPFPLTVRFVSADDGPRLAYVQRLDDKSPATFVGFPNPKGLISQQWSVAWEDTINGTDRSTGAIEQVTGAPIGVLRDPGAEFCRLGVQAGDAVSLRGCLHDLECETFGAVCFQPLLGNPGLCRPKVGVKEDEFRRTCGRLIESRRRWTVAEASQTGLTLGLRLDEIPRPSINPCTSSADCGGKFECLRLGGSEAPRCVQRCKDPGIFSGDQTCRAGRVCENVDGFGGSFCVEAPAPNAACWPRLLPYRVQAGHSYLVGGSLATRFATAKEDPKTGMCAPDADRNPVWANRIPLSAPACRSGLISDGVTPQEIVGRTTDFPAAAEGQGWGNPCLFSYTPPGEGAGATSINALFQNDQVRFVLWDMRRDPGDGLSNDFSIQAGRRPEIVDSRYVTVNLGVRILTSPTLTRESSDGKLFFPHIFVIDEGRSSLTRGQLLRIQPRTKSFPLRGTYDSRFTQSTYPIQ